MSVYALYKAARDEGAGELLDTDFVMRSFSGGFSGGTIASMMDVLHAASSDPDVRRQLADPYALSSDRALSLTSAHSRTCHGVVAVTSRRN